MRRIASAFVVRLGKHRDFSDLGKHHNFVEHLLILRNGISKCSKQRFGTTDRKQQLCRQFNFKLRISCELGK